MKTERKEKKKDNKLIKISKSQKERKIKEVKEIEFVSSGKERKACDNCGRHFRKLKRCKDGKNLCGYCMRNRVTNKFYIPKEDRIPASFGNRGNHIGNYRITNQENYILFNKFRKQGLPDWVAWKKVNATKNGLYTQKKIQSFKAVEDKKKITEQDKYKQDNHRKLIEGLKNYNS